MKRFLAILGVAIAGSQAGHLIAYGLRFGAAAQQLQSTGAHAYFPLVAKTFLGAAALALVGSLFLIGFARLAAGRQIDRASTPSLLRLLSALYTLQLGIFIAQEAIEGTAAGDLYLWALFSQLPVAFAGALALRWLLARLAPALAGIVRPVRLVLDISATVLPLRPAPMPAMVALAPVWIPVTRRGPPPSF